MSKKIMLLALAAVSATMLVVPAMASALVPVHVLPAPTQASTIKGGIAVLQTKGGLKITAKEVTGSVTWTSSTTGKISITFKNDITESLFGTSCGEIKTTELEFHVVTLPNGSWGTLITSNAGHFATFTCGGGLVKVVISGNGLIGRGISPACGSSSATTTDSFEQAGGVQSLKKVTGTETEYHLEASTNGGAKEEAGLGAEGIVTFSEGSKKIECT